MYRPIRAITLLVGLTVLSACGTQGRAHVLVIDIGSISNLE